MTMSYRQGYRNWPFLSDDEFELACAHFDQKYIQAKLGPTRKIFKVFHRRSLIKASTHIEIIRLLQLPNNPEDLSALFERLGRDENAAANVHMEGEILAREEHDHENMQTDQVVEGSGDRPPPYSLYSLQPYVTYEIFLHPTYQLPTLWFTLHDLPNGESPLDLDSVYRYLVPDPYKNQLRAIGAIGGISAAHHPLTDLPAFFIHPCQTKEAMESHECPIEEYLVLWIGLIGGCVGLWIPPEMIQATTPVAD